MTSILLARFWGMYIVIFGAMLFARPILKEQLFAFAKSKETIMAFGFITFTMGLVNIVLHNVWAWDYRLVITLFGWIALLRGISRMAYPELSINTIPKINSATYATWCGPCKALVPVLKEVAGDLKGRVRVIKIDVDKNQMLSQKYQVRSVPTLALFHNGRIVWRQSGVLGKHQIISEIENHLN